MAVMLAGCSSNWGESTLRVDYFGVDEGKVNACALLSGGLEHREDQGTSQMLVVRDIEVTDSVPGIWEIAGVTEVLHDDEDEHLAWSCRVSVDRDEMTMSADLLEIETVRP